MTFHRQLSKSVPPPIVMMGIPFDQIDSNDLVEITDDMIARRKPHLLATANIDFLTQAQKDEELQNILINADLVLCDGTPLVWISKWLGNPLPERLAGSDMVPLLLHSAEKKGHRVFFLGGSDHVIENAKKNITKTWPKLKIAGMYSPPYAPLEAMNHEDICQRIRAAKPDMLFVAFGCPKQEKWLAMHYKNIGVPITMGVGATIDFLAGTMNRAPVWMRHTGLEWVYRVAQEPKRLCGRYWQDICVAGPSLLKQILSMGFRKQQQAQPISPETPKEDIQVITLPERFDALAASETEKWPSAGIPTIIIDARMTEFIDSTGVGKLLRVLRATNNHDGTCVLVGAKKHILKTLELMKIRQLFTEVNDLHQAKQIAQK